MFRQIYQRHITCDFCGRLTRARRWDDEPDVMRCGSCHMPLSEGKFGTQEKEQTNTSHGTHRTLHRLPETD